MTIGAYGILGLISGAFLAAGSIPLLSDLAYVRERAKEDDHVLSTWLGYARLRSVPQIELLSRVLSTPLNARIDRELIRRVRRIRVATVLAVIGSIGIMSGIAIEVFLSWAGTTV